ncbi:D-alanyl-D-alanine carboxypeptidase/D-alanyl-D-alanine endopeptidase [Paractinoplanes hotanensis]|uniref:D-alanyl-D-alanine carboxypeptidase/D-alanyl-D-alanine-endopeptidase n=1 Tax=Paractinoplanes hotanensis TaxID=2906497 RepID=A0ABT0XQX4_9ACTN|nr:D-alanyl-D-alanine carboxypeptidase/D-alanyl-D-alanine-endopeptidase [Actinoplanes hotanensis]MCM4076169.1 D-alanyl-D-alanine carboxypeptidase/D-alanyl-D-alanine-endopeptidase [Actinoplanes hotanensis]
MTRSRAAVSAAALALGLALSGALPLPSTDSLLAPQPASAHAAAPHAAGPHAAAADPAGIGQAIDDILADPVLAGSQVGVVVADAGTGATLLDRGGARRLLPASNAKLFTSAAALAILGPGHRFATEARALGVRWDASLAGDLYLRGEGDPALTPAGLDALARDVAASGLREVTGDLVADDTSFDSQRLGLEWAWDDEAFSGAAPVSALTMAPDKNYLAGTVNVKVAPAPVDRRPARVSVSPHSKQLTVVNQAITAHGITPVSVTRGHGTDVLTVTGAIPKGTPAVVEPVTVRDATALTADVFRQALRRHGVRVKGRIVTGRAAPAEAVTLARHLGPPLRDLVAPLLKLSNNGMSELLVKAIGRKAAGVGSWPAGTNAVAAYLGRLGVDTTTMRQVDGSGLSRRNLVPPGAFARFLVAVRAEPWFPVWFAALPVAGHPDRMTGGTLRNRMRGTVAAGTVRAKTGTLTGASALSGYVTTPGHRPLVFSAIVNNQLSPSVTPVLDRIAVALAGYPQAPVTVGPSL